MTAPWTLGDFAAGIVLAGVLCLLAFLMSFGGVS